jgi:hypothetical protein
MSDISNRGMPAAENKDKLKWPAPHIDTGEGVDRDLQWINAWF